MRLADALAVAARTRRDAAPDRASDEGMPMLGVRVGAEWFALPLDAVRAVLDAPVAVLDALVAANVMTHGDALVPVYAPHRALGAATSPAADAPVIVVAGVRDAHDVDAGGLGRDVALRVDEVVVLRGVRRAAATEASALDVGRDGVIDAVLRVGPTLVALVDPLALVAACRTRVPVIP